MGGYLGILGILILSAIAMLLLKSFGWRGAPVVVIFALLLSLERMIGAMLEVTSLINSLSSYSNVKEYIGDGLRAVGIGYLGGISADTCASLGESGIASAVQLTTRAELIALAIPYICELLSLVFNFAYA